MNTEGSLDSSDLGDSDGLYWRIIDAGEVVAKNEWDSGGPGAGSGEIEVYLYEGQYFAFDDGLGLQGPFKTKGEAKKAVDLDTITSATVSIWDIDEGSMVVERDDKGEIIQIIRIPATPSSRSSGDSTKGEPGISKKEEDWLLELALKARLLESLDEDSKRE